MKRLTSLSTALLLILLLSACVMQPDAGGEGVLQQTPTLVVTPGATVVPSAEPPTPAAESQPPTTSAQPSASSTGTAEMVEPSAEPLPTGSPPAAEMSPAEAVAAELAALLPPERDDRRLAIAFRGLQDSELPLPEVVDEPLTVGTQQSFTIVNVVENTVSEINAELFAVSDHAYFWFDLGPGSVVPTQEDLARATEVFDKIYEVTTEQFGPERNPGIDGDPRLHIVNASPIALCGVTEQTLDQCVLAGVVNSIDLLPAAVDPRSNEREMFVMNARRFGSDYYLGVLAHEFRHMIEDNYDRSEADWEIEGSATLAAELAGLPSGGVERGNMFLANPDQQLNAWIDEGTGPYYGQGFLYNRYLYEQLGPQWYEEFATHPLPGFQAVDALVAEHGLERDSQALWLDYLVALAIHNNPQADARYRFAIDGLNTAAMTTVGSLPATFDEEVSQYAADYYDLPAGLSTIDFSGSAQVSLLGTEPPLGEWYWFAQRANYSNPRLTYDLDLGDVDIATLSYDVYTDLEQGYDFAYVSVSLDGGRTWLPLETENMQGSAPEDNPAGSALTEHFYTGRRREWVHESVDLSAYAGQDIRLRFEYVTDPILTYGGLALDNIAVPEIGFFDGAEGDDALANAEGFMRATADIRQTWHLQHITFENGVPEVNQLAVDGDGELHLALESATGTRSILIVAANAPTTLEKASYELTLGS